MADSKKMVQLRLRLPEDLHAEIESEALASGSTVQRELLTRIIRGGKGVEKSQSAARVYGEINGELEVAEKLLMSLQAVCSSMRVKAQPPEEEPEVPMIDDESAANE